MNPARTRVSLVGISLQKMSVPHLSQDSQMDSDGGTVFVKSDHVVPVVLGYRAFFVSLATVIGKGVYRNKRARKKGRSQRIDVTVAYFLFTLFRSL